MGHLCVNQTGLPVVRRCLGNNKWEHLGNVTCQFDQAANEISKSLNEISVELTEGVPFRDLMPNDYRDIVQNITRIVSQAKHNIQPVDVMNVNRIIKVVSKEPKNENISNEMITLYNQLLTTDSSVLELSARMNATNELIFNYEDYMNQVAKILGPLKSCKEQQPIDIPSNLVDVKVYNGVQILIMGSLGVFYLYPECNKYTGIAIYDRGGHGRKNCKHHNFWYQLLYANQNLNDLKDEPGLQTATYLTNELWTALKKSGATYLIFKIYANNAFFIQTNLQTEKAILQSHVLSIDIPQVSDTLPHPLVFLLRNEIDVEVNKKDIDSFCGYWNYDKWEKDGITMSENGSSDDPIVVCYTTHLTQFAFLVGGSFKQRRGRIDDQDMEKSFSYESRLDDVSAVGCGLSLFGLLVIWLTAMLSKNWRSQRTTKLLLNLSLALWLLFVLLLIVYVNEWVWRFSFIQDHAECIALGALLQYSVLLLFMWMLLIGYRQYQLFVTVFAVGSQHMVLRMATIAGLMPLIPTLLLLFIDSSSYTPLKDEGDIGTLCYPSGRGLVYGVLLPIGLVLIANVYMFGRIFYSISHMQNRNCQLLLEQYRRFVLLFFLLGLTWIFGIFSYLELGLVFNFIFCVTASIQGFILFVYFVVLDKVPRDAWLHLLIGKQQSNLNVES
ncbi:adhesion G-protein coupled receptor G4-like [Drosophila innubila]|uniref:adhesion G-protein coupled receptor G4-like n=1 Tax=Drosophila innubila TaxID=198719 RepID=UPI00148C1DA1|nr:adhesion G-protein coupled receptor G4-like [Drosophila innubila]